MLVISLFSALLKKVRLNSRKVSNCFDILHLQFYRSENTNNTAYCFELCSMFNFHDFMQCFILFKGRFFFIVIVHLFIIIILKFLKIRRKVSVIVIFSALLRKIRLHSHEVFKFVYHVQCYRIENAII